MFAQVTAINVSFFLRHSVVDKSELAVAVDDSNRRKTDEAYKAKRALFVELPNELVRLCQNASYVIFERHQPALRATNLRSLAKDVKVSE